MYVRGDPITRHVGGQCVRDVSDWFLRCELHDIMPGWLAGMLTTGRVLRRRSGEWNVQMQPKLLRCGVLTLLPT